MALEIRVLKFLDVEKVVIVTDRSNLSGKFVVKDVVNFAGINTLRGENYNEFGTRFPDLSAIRDEKMAEKLGYEQKIFRLNLD